MELLVESGVGGPAWAGIVRAKGGFDEVFDDLGVVNGGCSPGEIGRHFEVLLN